MNKNLVRTIDSCTADNLIAKLSPAAETFGIKIRKEASAETTYKRGTILAMSSRDNKCVILGTTAQAAVQGDSPVAAEELTPYCILADDVTVGKTADAVAVAYRCGNFNRSAVIAKSGHTLSAADEDALRHYNIILTDVM